MDLHYLELFNTIAKHGSYKKASDVLHITQPALSIQIKKLESQTNLKLFYKSGNKVYLSEDGLRLYEHTKKIFELVDDMERDITNSNDYIGGTINLGGSNTPGTYILPYVIGEMKKRYPLVTYNLHIANTTEIFAMIENGSLDVAVSGGICNFQETVYVEKILNDKLVVVASDKNALTRRKQIIFGDLLHENFVVHEKSSQLYTSYRMFRELAKLPENVTMYLGSIDAIKHAVSANLGISIMPYFAVKAELDLGMLKELKIKNFDYDYPYHLIYNKKKNNSLTAQTFIEILKEICESFV
jgi:DNA-binding transcriptional LysR family regulator